MGQYYGRVPDRWSAESLALSVVVHDRKRVNEEHAHEAAFVTMMLAGEYRETAARRSFRFDPFVTLYHPAAIEHQDVVGPAGVRLLMFEFRTDLLDGAQIGRSDAGSLRDLSGSLAAWRMLSLYRLAPFDSLEFESRAMQLVAELAPLVRNAVRDVPSLERAREYLHAHFRSPMTMQEIGSASGLHPVYLGQAFHRNFGETVGSYVARLRVRATAEQLAKSRAPLAAIACEHGFCDQSHFQRVFKKMCGVTPSAFRRSFSAT